VKRNFDDKPDFGNRSDFGKGGNGFNDKISPNSVTSAESARKIPIGG